jgi:cobalamin-dependent methionine synthase I
MTEQTGSVSMNQAEGQVVELDVRVETDEVLRMMGCGKEGKLRPEHRALVEHLIEESASVIRARGTYAVHPVTRMTDSELVLAQCPPIRGPIAGFLKPATRVAAFVATVGDEIERMADDRLRKGARLEGYILNSIGSAAADAAVDALADIIYFEDANPEEALTPPFSPGYCGLSLDEQISLFAMVNTRPLGVRLLPTMIMQPLKSVSGLIGIGPSNQVEAHGVPCQWCDLTTCHMRR